MHRKGHLLVVALSGILSNGKPLPNELRMGPRYRFKICTWWRIVIDLRGSAKPKGKWDKKAIKTGDPIMTAPDQKNLGHSYQERQQNRGLHKNNDLPCDGNILRSSLGQAIDSLSALPGVHMVVLSQSSKERISIKYSWSSNNSHLYIFIRGIVDTFRLPLFCELIHHIGKQL